MDHAKEEGIVFSTLNAPLEIISNCEGTGIKGLRTQVNMFENERIISVEGQFGFFPCQMLVIAVG